MSDYFVTLNNGYGTFYLASCPEAGAPYYSWVGHKRGAIRLPKHIAEEVETNLKARRDEEGRLVRAEELAKDLFETLTTVTEALKAVIDGNDHWAQGKVEGAEKLLKSINTKENPGEEYKATPCS